MDSGYSSNSEEDSKTTGLMGMNRGSLSFVSQMGFPKFSYCISGSDSSGFYFSGTRDSRGSAKGSSGLRDPNFVFQGAMDLCYRVTGSSRQSLSNLPRVSLMFRGAEMSVSGERLLYRVPEMSKGSDSVYCFTFGNSDLLGIEAFVIGHHHQQNVWMEFDL
ncbi:hypothetical protein GQ457_12G032060 [Hibiscus cannabinus]